MALANDGIAFPVAHTGFIINDSWAFINAGAVGNASPKAECETSVFCPVGFRVVSIPSGRGLVIWLGGG
jgi:hypothetical protein